MSTSNLKENEISYIIESRIKDIPVKEVLNKFVEIPNLSKNQVQDISFHIEESELELFPNKIPKLIK